ncbi:MAG: guanylate kinase [FCB group bacterium]|nr:guanylate kinase [FCB group bacterium]
MSKGLLVVLSAPSGTGKSTICRKLLERNPDWTFSVSVTTRPQREGEVDGDDYIFMDVDKFEHYIKFGDFVEWEWVHGNKYGTLIGPLEDALDENKLMLLDIDVKGGTSIMEEFPDDTISFFVEPPGDTIAEQLEVLEERLTKRGKEPPTIIKRRIKRFQIELEYKDKFDHHVINDDLETVVNEIESKIKEVYK